MSDAERVERLLKLAFAPVDMNPLAAVEVSNGLAERDDLASLAVAIGLGVER